MTGTLKSPRPGVDGIVAITWHAREASIEASETPGRRLVHQQPPGHRLPGVVGTVRDRSSLRVSIWT